MKLSVALLIVLVVNSLSISEGFSTSPGGQNLQPTSIFLRVARQQVPSVGRSNPLSVAATVEDETKSDFGSAMPPAVDPHDIIGVEPEKLALGINPDEFLEWVGT
jgi:hypothetical protein